MIPIIMSASRAFWGRLADEEKKMFSVTAIEAMKYRKPFLGRRMTKSSINFKEKWR
jgi:hypothetical protein